MKHGLLIIIISSENVNYYFSILVNRYDLYLKVCPFCGHDHLIRWGYYRRGALPVKGSIRIQRIRCTQCGHATNVLPSFLLARKSYSVSLLKELVMSFVQHPDYWKDTVGITIDLSTAYRWLRLLHRQALESLPAIRKALLKFNPSHPVIDPTDVKAEALTTSRDILKRFLWLSEQLFKAAVRLVDDNYRQNDDLFCFLNYFLAKKTEKALLLG